MDWTLKSSSMAFLSQLSSSCVLRISARKPKREASAMVGFSPNRNGLFPRYSENA